MKVDAVIEKGPDGLYSVYVKDELQSCSLNGQGRSVEEAKQEMLIALDEIKELCLEEDGKVPDELLGIEFNYQYDLASLFDYFKEINVSALARRVGINESLLRRYRNGLAFASDVQLKKVEDGLRHLGQELSSVRF